MPERTYKIICNECGYSEEVPESRLPYEEGKTCPRCYKGKMYWVPPTEEARRREAKMQEERISPALIIIPVGLGLAVAAVVALAALARVAVPPGCLKLSPDRFYYFIYTGPNQTFKAALGECWDVIWIIEFYDEDTGDWIAPTDPMHDLIEPGREYRVKVMEPCTLCGFELI
ncbi:hypothetical protein ES703_91720 [subsurface metagenome]